MRLREVATEGFRNLIDGRLALAPGTTVLLGDNGQGKTNLLEAVGVLATTKSFRRAKTPELARHGSRSWRVAGNVESRGGVVELEVGSEEGRRVTRAARIAVELTEYIGHLTVVPITQASAGIVRGGPQERRDFLDRGILGARPAYLRVLARYRRTVKQKTALLRARRPSGPELDTWNERLAEDGAEVTSWRRAHAAELAERLAEIGETFLPAAEPLALRLEDVVAREPALLLQAESGAPLDRSAVAEALGRRLRAAAEREAAAGQALVGPHRDDLALSLAGRDVRRFASSGQQRNAVLALLLAEVEVFRRRRGETPVLLVDDVDTEIDRKRLSCFLEHVGGRCQTLLTSSKRDLFGAPPADALFYAVEAGSIRPLP